MTEKMSLVWQEMAEKLLSDTSKYQIAVQTMFQKTKGLILHQTDHLFLFWFDARCMHPTNIYTLLLTKVSMPFYAMVNAIVMTGAMNPQCGTSLHVHKNEN